jgi:predicted DNA-binding transcriptional regulator YafY
MRMDKYGRELELIILLTSNNNLTAQQIADKLEITRRNLYYYFDYLRDCGFKLIKQGVTYRLDRQSSFFTRLHENIPLNEQEAAYVLRCVNDSDLHDPSALTVKMKLERYYNFIDMTDPENVKRVFRNVNIIRQAISERKVIKMLSYSSPHSHTVSDRIVEPFLMLNNFVDVRCYEISSHTNKTFKISRIKGIEKLDIDWFNEKAHKQFFTDAFTFSGEERHHISLKLGQLSHNLLIEEYPLAEQYITKIDDGTWLFDTFVVSYLAPARFVLGLYDDIQVEDGDEFKNYLNKKITNMKTFLIK